MDRDGEPIEGCGSESICTADILLPTKPRGYLGGSGWIGGDDIHQDRFAIREPDDEVVAWNLFLEFPKFGLG
jgi:hypothetical protein